MPTDQGLDVPLRYMFPAKGLGVSALGALCMPVISGAAKLRLGLLTGSPK